MNIYLLGNKMMLFGFPLKHYVRVTGVFSNCDKSEGGKRGAPLFLGRVANQSPNTRVFLPFVLLEMETGRLSPSTAADDKSDDELIDEEEVNRMTTVESVVTEIGLTHPIVCDIYDL